MTGTRSPHASDCPTLGSHSDRTDARWAHRLPFRAKNGLLCHSDHSAQCYVSSARPCAPVSGTMQLSDGRVPGDNSEPTFLAGCCSTADPRPLLHHVYQGTGSGIDPGPPRWTSDPDIGFTASRMGCCHRHVRTRPSSTKQRRPHPSRTSNFRTASHPLREPPPTLAAPERASLGGIAGSSCQRALWVDDTWLVAIMPTGR